MSKYFKYAIGEILLVVIGILIALQINNWNDYRKERKVERDYLQRIITDLSVDTTNFSWTTRQLIVKQDYLGALLTLIKEDNIASADSITVLGYVVFGTYLAIDHPHIANGTFEELKNTGAMQYVTNTQLRTDINRYYFKGDAQYSRIDRKRMQSEYATFVNKTIPGLQGTKDGKLSYRDDLISYNEILDLLRSEDFKKHTISEYNNTVFMLRVQEGGLEDSKALIDLLNTAIKE